MYIQSQILVFQESDLRPTRSGVEQIGLYMNPKKEYEEFMHKLPERCFLIQGMLKHINKYNTGGSSRWLKKSSKEVNHT